MVKTGHLEKKIKRYEEFYANDDGAIMITTSLNSNMDDELAKRPNLEKINWDKASTLHEYAKDVLAYRKSICGIEGVDDDTVVNANVLAGTGAIGAATIKDGVLVQEKDTNYLQVPITDWEDYDETRIGFDINNKYYQMQMEILKYFVAHWDGDYAVTPFLHFGPLDMANQFRGNEILYDFYNYPDELHGMLQKCTDTIIEMEDYSRKTFYNNLDIPTAVGSFYIPSGGYLSCDLGDMISSDFLEEFELPYIQKITDIWKGGHQHHHELGIHQIASWTKCDKLSLQFLNRDLNTKHLGLMVDEQIIQCSKTLPIHFICTYEEFMHRYASWAKGKFLIEVRCDNKEQAKEVTMCARRCRGY